MPVIGLTVLASAGAAAAAEGSLPASLSPTPVSSGDGSGTGPVEISGTNLSLKLGAQGLPAGAPHATHIHLGEAQMTIEHHRGAVEMAEKEVADGSYPDPVAIARDRRVADGGAQGDGDAAEQDRRLISGAAGALSAVTRAIRR